LQEIDSIWLSINLLNKKNRSAFKILVNDFRIRGYIVEIDSHFKRRVSSEEKPLHQLPSSNSQSDYLIINQLGYLKWFNFITLEIANFSFNQLAISSVNLRAECLLNSTIQELHLSIVKKDRIAGLKLKSSGISAKLLKHSSEETCLVHLSLNLEINLFSETSLLDLDVNINGLHSTLNEGFYSLFLDYQDNSIDNYHHHVRDQTFLSQLQDLPIKQLLVNVKGLSLQLIRDRGQKVLTIENEENSFKMCKVSNSEILFDLLIKEFKNTSGHCQLAFLQTLLFEVKLEEERSIDHCLKVSIRSELISFHCDYIESEIDQWIDLIAISRSKIEDYQEGQKSQSVLSKIFKSDNAFIKLNLCSEFRDIEFRFEPKVSNQPLISTLTNGKLTTFVNPDPIHRELR